jgi:phytoene dehydrogenase-like protein
VADTAAILGSDGARWARIFGPLTQRFDRITADFLKPMLHVPAHPLALARFGFLSGLPASALARIWSTS